MDWDMTPWSSSVLHYKHHHVHSRHLGSKQEQAVLLCMQV